MDYIVVYTDGSCNYKTRHGGIGSHITYFDDVIEISKGYCNTTIGRMELKAIIESMKVIKNKRIPIQFNVDSEYIVNSINKRWLFRWELENFVLRKNSDLWKEFIYYYKHFKDIQFVWCKGHSKIDGNEKADKLANYKNFKVFEQDLK